MQIDNVEQKIVQTKSKKKKKGFKKKHKRRKSERQLKDGKKEKGQSDDGISRNNCNYLIFYGFQRWIDNLESISEPNILNF